MRNKDIKVYLVWIPKYRKKILIGDVAFRVRDIIRQIALQHEIVIISGKVAQDHIHRLVSYPTTLSLAKMVQYIKGGSSLRLMNKFPNLKKKFWGGSLLGIGYFAVSSGTITDEVIQEYINEQEGEPVLEDSRFSIDSPPRTL